MILRGATERAQVVMEVSLYQWSVCNRTVFLICGWVRVKYVVNPVSYDPIQR